MLAKNILTMHCRILNLKCKIWNSSSDSIRCLEWSYYHLKLPLEQEKQYDSLNRRNIESFDKMALFWLVSKWKKKLISLWGSISLYITTPWCFMNIKIYNSNFPFQATDSDYLIFQMINLETRQIPNHKNIYWHVSVDWNLRQVASG